MTLLSRRRLLVATLAAGAAAAGGYLLRPGVPATPDLLAMQATTADAPAAESPSAELPPVAEMALGSADAPVTMIEYGSYTCPHCAAFHAENFPKLKAEYIDTGKVRFVYREVYFDRLGLWAGMLARCQGGERYFGIADLLFTNQQDWARKETAPEAVEAMMALGRQAGLADADMQACIQDQATAESLVAEFQKNYEADEIEGTPTFIIGGKKVSNGPWEDIKAEIDAALGG
jgi:protein-disulfide isomerase